ncbi:MAG: general secretion pathway protein GspK [Verrucomicrobiota bacterium]|nr:general secretion pathway protein GspK [Verrucomicrobiota bacterium]
MISPVFQMSNAGARLRGEPVRARRRRAASTQGSALLLTLWALMLLSAAVLAWAQLVQNDIELSGEANRAVEARAMAHSGLAIALHPLVTQKTPLLDEELADGMGFAVQMSSEGARLNVRWLLEGEDPRKKNIFMHWLEQMELTFQERETFVDCLLDYIDGDNIKRLNGLEDQGEYHPPNRPLLSVEEIEKVPNSEFLTSKPNWKEHLTILSQGPIDLSAAPVEVLRLLPGLGEARIQELIKRRQGLDGLDFTVDDHQFKSVKEIQQALSMTDLQMRELSGLVTVRDQTMRLVSEGYSGEVVRQIQVVARKSGPNPAILAWKE